MTHNYHTPPEETITQILCDLREGKRVSTNEFFHLVYAELRQLAAQQMARERPDHTLVPTALVHEAFMRLFGEKLPSWENRAHFFGAAAQAMRRVLVDHARKHQAQKRGGGRKRVTLDENVSTSDVATDEVLEVDAALKKLSELDPRKGKLVELRFFGGLSVEQTAHVLGVSQRTVKRDWSYAQAWLYREVHDPEVNDQ